MQIKISKEDVLEALDRLECRRATKLLREHYTLPDFISFGELLEGGTVEKCCEACFDERHWQSRLTDYDFPLSHYCKNKHCCCHNKKEESLEKN